MISASEDLDQLRKVQVWGHLCAHGRWRAHTGHTQSTEHSTEHTQHMQHTQHTQHRTHHSTPGTSAQGDSVYCPIAMPLRSLSRQPATAVLTARARTRA